MRIDNVYIEIKVFFVGVLLIVAIALGVYFGFKIPPQKLCSPELFLISTISINKGETIKLTTDEIEYWNKLEFDIVENDNLGATPDFLIDLGLIGKQISYTALYNKGGRFVYCIFPEMKYGIFNSPPPGGWHKPIYKIKANKELLEFLNLTAQ